MITHFITYRPNKDRAKLDTLDRYEDFMTWKELGRIEQWSARKTFQPGDFAIFYMAAPLMSIVALGVIDSEPYYDEKQMGDPDDFKNPVFCDFRPVWFLDKLVPIKEAVDHQKLQGWWATCPYQSIRRIDPSVAEALVSEVLDSNPDLAKELQRSGFTLSLLSEASRKFPKVRAVAHKHQWELQDLLDLSWEQFELLVSEIFKRKNKNSTVELTRVTGDYGVDVVITSGLFSKKEIVQCKKYRPEVKVSSPDMQRFVGAMAKFKAKRGYFVTTSTFSRYAAKFARGMNVELIDGQNLVEMIAGVKDFPSPAEFTS
jgi:HJR/Mrr/RecB family endonuclease